MFFRPFYSDFPKIAAKQTRSITIPNEIGGLQKGEYGFIELYCSDKHCDCRRVMIQVLTPDADRPLAVISYGWEPKPFYRKWAKALSDEDLNWFKGPALDPYQPQGQYSEILLLHFKLQLGDKKYTNRLIGHYVMVKQKQGMKLPKDLQPWFNSMNPCGCDSGTAFRFCCGKK
jgi:hypothetical protein